MEAADRQVTALQQNQGVVIEKSSLNASGASHSAENACRSANSRSKSSQRHEFVETTTTTTTTTTTATDKQAIQCMVAREV